MTNVARKGMKFEKAVAFQMNNYFVNNLLENVAHANGGAGNRQRGISIVAAAE